MIKLKLGKMSSVADAQAMVQAAISVEFGTLPAYLYPLYAILPGTNPESAARLKAIAMQEMTHMCLACNILNAIGGTPTITAPVYPGPLPGDIGNLILHLYPFNRDAIAQGMAIETPTDPIDIPERAKAKAHSFAEGQAVTIGEFYQALDALLSTLPPEAWIPNRHQIIDDQFLIHQIFAVNTYDDAHRAIEQIISEGEGSPDDPIDDEDEVAHYYKFGEIYHDRVLTKTSGLAVKASPLPPEIAKARVKSGYQWGPARLGVDYAQSYPAITDPSIFDFSTQSPAVRAAQAACNAAYSAMIDHLQQAVTGNAGALGQAVRAMFDLRMAALHAFTVPLSNGQVAGPAFIYQASLKTGAKQ